MGLSSGNSVGVAISQPRVEVRSASTLGIGTKKDSNSVGVALSRRRYRSRIISGTAANNTIINNKQGDTKNTKNRGDSCRLRLGVLVGDASRKTSFPPHRRHHPHRHARHDDSSHDGKKNAAVGRSKSPPLAVQKQQLIPAPPNSLKGRERIESHSLALPKGRKFIESPSLAIPNGREFILAAFVEVVVALISLGKGWAGVSLGWLVTYVTWSRINCYVLTCLMSRALVSNVTSRRGCPRGCRNALA